MRTLTVVGLSSDGHSLVLRAGTEVFEVPRDEVTRAEQALPFAEEPVPTPREVQQRIRRGESAAQIARLAGLPVESVARYEGPPLAEREHHVRGAQAARVDGRPVVELVDEHAERAGLDPAETVWDAVLVEPGRWEVTARGDRFGLALRWEPGPKRVTALDEPARQALRLAPLEQDALGAVLRPVSARRAAAAAATSGIAPVTPVTPAAVPAPPSGRGPGEATAGLSPWEREPARAEDPYASQPPLLPAPAAAPEVASGPPTRGGPVAQPTPARRSRTAGRPSRQVPPLPSTPGASGGVGDGARAAAPGGPPGGPGLPDGVRDGLPDEVRDGAAPAPLDTAPEPGPRSSTPTRPRRGRVSVPSWDAISTEVTGRGSDDPR